MTKQVGFYGKNYPGFSESHAAPRRCYPLLRRTDLERALFSLPARFAGLGIANPCTQSEKQFKNSEELTAPLLKLILAQDQKLNAKHMRKTQDCIREIQKNQTEAVSDGQLAG